MVVLAVRGRKLQLQVRGLDRLWAMRSRLDIPLSAIRGVRADPEVAKGLWKGVSAPGTHIPGLIIAGTFYQDSKRIFWDVHDPEKTIVIDLDGQRYDQIIIEVGDPAQAVQLILGAMESEGTAQAAPPVGSAIGSSGDIAS